jgi:hypothetical protein
MNTKNLARVCTPWLLAIAPMALSSCRTEQAGAVIVAMQTDMQVPKDITHVGVFVSYDGVIKMSRVVKVNAETENGRFVTLPSTLAVVSSKDSPGSRVRVRVMAFQSNGGSASDPGLRARVARDAVFTVPEERRALLRMPLQFVSDGSATGTVPQASSVLNLASHGARFAADAIDFETGLGAFDFPCREGKTDILGTCESWDVDSSKLPDYSERDVFGDAPGASCFSTKEAFSSVQTLPVAGCTVSLSAPDPSRVNFAFDTSGGQPCTDNAPCVAPMDGPGSTAPFYSVTPSSDGKLSATFAKGVCAKLGNKVTVGFGAPIKTDKQSVCSNATRGAVPAPSPEGGTSSCVERWDTSKIEDVTLAETELSGIGLDPTVNRVYFVRRGETAAPPDTDRDYYLAYVTPGTTPPQGPQAPLYFATFEQSNVPRAFTVRRSLLGSTAIAVHGAPGGDKLGLVVKPDGANIVAVSCLLDPCPNLGAADLELLPGGVNAQGTFWFGAAGVVHSVGIGVDGGDNLLLVPDLELDPDAGAGIPLSDTQITGAGFVPWSSGVRRVLGSAAGAALCDWPSLGNCSAIAGGEGGSVFATASYLNGQTQQGELLFLRGAKPDGKGSGLSRLPTNATGAITGTSRVQLGRNDQTPFVSENGLALDGPNVFVTVGDEILSTDAQGQRCQIYQGSDLRQILVSPDRYVYFTEKSGTGRRIRRYKLKDIGAP